jgi:thymidylate kinase
MDRAGKSLQRRALLAYLSERGYDPVYRWSRVGYTRRIERVKRWLRRLRGRSAGEGGAPRSYPQRASRLGSPVRRWLWTTVALLDLLWEYAVSVRLLRARGHAVVCDRWLCDALVDFRVNFPQDRVEDRLLWRLVARLAARPDATFLLLISPEESLRRARASGRRHVEPSEVLEARLLEYRRLAECGEGDAIDAGRDPERIAEELRERLEACLGPGSRAGGEKLSRAIEVAAFLPWLWS